MVSVGETVGIRFARAVVGTSPPVAGEAFENLSHVGSPTDSSVHLRMRKYLIAPVMLVGLFAAGQSLVPAASLPALSSAAVCPVGSSCGVTLPSSKHASDVPEFTMQKDIREVRVEFKVTDRRGHNLDSITASDFQIMDDGREVPALTGFRRESDLPINIAILIDSSRSTASELPMEKQLALDFLTDFLRTGDTALIAGFNSHLVAPTAFTGDIARLRASVDSIQAGGLTGFNDALYELANGFFPSVDRNSARNVLVILSDGYDTVSIHTLRDALDASLARNITIYTVSVLDKKAPVPARSLRELSDKTAGDSLQLERRKDLDKTFKLIDAELRSYFVATYKAGHRDGAFHSLAVRLARKDLTAQTRVGYFASN